MDEKSLISRLNGEFKKEEVEEILSTANSQYHHYDNLQVIPFPYKIPVFDRELRKTIIVDRFVAAFCTEYETNGNACLEEIKIGDNSFVIQRSKSVNNEIKLSQPDGYKPKCLCCFEIIEK